jgi:hypothetical protein
MAKIDSTRSTSSSSKTYTLKSLLLRLGFVVAAHVGRKRRAVCNLLARATAEPACHPRGGGLASRARATRRGGVLRGRATARGFAPGGTRPSGEDLSDEGTGPGPAEEFTEKGANRNSVR